VVNLRLPVSPALLGMKFFTQGLAIDTPTNVLGGVTSDAAAAIVGR
jgi:hypothetical protein